jgi:hypothetical protein
MPLIVLNLCCRKYVAENIYVACCGDVFMNYLTQIANLLEGLMILRHVIMYKYLNKVCGTRSIETKVVELCNMNT